MTTTDLIDDVLDIVENLPAHAGNAADSVVNNDWWVALFVLGTGAAVAVARWLLSRGLMADRTAVEVLPTTDFDPKPEEVVRFGHQIARAHKSVSRWLVSSSRGSAVRVRFTCSGGALSMRVEGPERAMSVLRHQGYAQVEMRPVEAGDPAARERPEIRLGSQPAS
ncbi:hypothetical protein [Streptomyces sp. NPDC092903]|uniref:hypothetical protein n=1 Tax=Streptomyces sp. NPDC092903 TaxID=3366017 RepID=UPI003822551F